MLLGCAGSFHFGELATGLRYGSCELADPEAVRLSLSICDSCVLMEVTCSTLEPESKGGDKSRRRGSLCGSPEPEGAESQALSRSRGNGLVS